MKIVGEIPARIGSKRVKKKNLRLLNGKSMISYAITAAKNSKLLNEVYVNSDSDLLGRVATEHEVQYYKRSKQLASDNAKQEEFNYDFIKNTSADVLVMINPVSPLIDSVDIDNVIQFFLDNDYDTVITTEDIRQQVFYKGEPVNINPYELLQPTQKISPIQLCTWTVTIWRASTFIETYENKKYGAFSGKVGFYPLPREKCLKISYEEDFKLVESILKSKDQVTTPVKYYNP
jgi:CMP-N-acetylneuraminic acid synthetase